MNVSYSGANKSIIEQYVSNPPAFVGDSFVFDGTLGKVFQIAVDGNITRLRTDRIASAELVDITEHTNTIKMAEFSSRLEEFIGSLMSVDIKFSHLYKFSRNLIDERTKETLTYLRKKFRQMLYYGNEGFYGKALDFGDKAIDNVETTKKLADHLINMALAVDANNEYEKTIILLLPESFEKILIEPVAAGSAQTGVQKILAISKIAAIKYIPASDHGTIFANIAFAINNNTTTIFHAGLPKVTPSFNERGEGETGSTVLPITIGNNAVRLVDDDSVVYSTITIAGVLEANKSGVEPSLAALQKEQALRKAAKAQKDLAAQNTSDNSKKIKEVKASIKAIQDLNDKATDEQKETLKKLIEKLKELEAK